MGMGLNPRNVGLEGIAPIPGFQRTDGQDGRRCLPCSFASVLLGRPLPIPWTGGLTAGEFLRITGRNSYCGSIVGTTVGLAVLERSGAGPLNCALADPARVMRQHEARQTVDGTIGWTKPLRLPCRSSRTMEIIYDILIDGLSSPVGGSAGGFRPSQLSGVQYDPGNLRPGSQQQIARAPHCVFARPPVPDD
jgi:hypothetical protein